MKKFFTPLSVFLICCISSSIFGQNTIINNFETGSPALVSRYGVSSNISVVPNPNPAGLNTTANCAKIVRTTSNWYELFAFNANVVIPAGTKKYLHMKVNYYAQPDISIRIDAATSADDGSADIRAMNKYTDLGMWQDLVFEMDGGASGHNVTAFVVLPDLGFENIPAGLVLNDTDKFGYIDEISVSDSATPLVFDGNTMLNNFETGSPTSVSRYGVSSNISVVPNPFPAGLNTTANCAKIIRTSSNWYELFGFPTSYVIPANTKKYLHMKVNYYAQPDISIRIDAANENADGDGNAGIRAMNKYTDLGMWQDLVFEMDGGLVGRTVNAIIVLPDMGWENVPAGLVLNDTDKFGYIDEISVSDSASPTVLSVNKLEKTNSISIYPNPTSDYLTISNLQANAVLSVFSLDGKKVYQNKNNTDSTITLSVNEWSKGAYIVRIQNGRESIVKKIIID